MDHFYFLFTKNVALKNGLDT